MGLPLLKYPVTSQNHRVAGYEVAGDEQPFVYRTDFRLSPNEVDRVIQAAYRQVYNEQQLIAQNRQIPLESQLRSGQITVRGFIRGLALSESFRRHNFDCNNNYRFVQICVQRFLGRDVYDEREKLAWSVVVATQGIKGFIDALLTSDEYQENFGENTVPHQRRRILPQRDRGDVTFAHVPRYGEDYRVKLEAIGYFFGNPKSTRWSCPGPRWEWQKPPYTPAYRIFVAVLAGIAVALILATFVTTVLAALGIASF
jgi:phycobilisome rod-core linker protein